MYEGKTVFSQLTAHLPRRTFRRLVKRYGVERRVRSFTCWNQFLAMAFAQITYRQSLRDIEACLSAVPAKLYHMGFRAPVSRSTLADANERRDWRIWADFAQRLIGTARRLYADEPLDVELEQTVYALDSTTIDLSLTLFPWARFRRTKSAVKLHTLLDLAGNIPVFAWITEGKLHDVNILDHLRPEPGSIYILDRGYIDYQRLARLDRCRATFVVRAKKNLQFRRLYSHTVDRSTGLICDQTIRLTGVLSGEAYPDQLRRVRYTDREHDQRLVLLTNDFDLDALTVTELYRARWQIEIFFKWIKQHLRIQHFYGTSANAVKTQIWIAITVYVLVAIVKKRLAIERDLYTMLQILSVTVFEKVPLPQALTRSDYSFEDTLDPNQLPLFDL